MSKEKTLRVEDIEGWEKYRAGTDLTFPLYGMVEIRGRVSVFKYSSLDQFNRQVCALGCACGKALIPIATAPIPTKKVSCEFLGKELIHKNSFPRYTNKCIGFTMGGDCIMEDGDIWEQKDCEISCPTRLYYFDLDREGCLDFIELRYDRG